MLASPARDRLSGAADRPEEGRASRQRSLPSSEPLCLLSLSREALHRPSKSCRIKTLSRLARPRLADRDQGGRPLARRSGQRATDPGADQRLARARARAVDRATLAPGNGLIPVQRAGPQVSPFWASPAFQRNAFGEQAMPPPSFPPHIEGASPTLSACSLTAIAAAS